MKGMRSYKSRADEQREAFSDLLNHGQSIVAVEQYKPSTGVIAPAYHQHSFNVTEQAVVSDIN